MKLKKIICVLMSALILNTCTIPTVTHATEVYNNEENVEGLDDSKVEEVAEMIRFLVQDASIYTEEGDWKNYNFELIREVYGNDPLLDDLESALALSEYLTSKNSSNIEERTLVIDSTCVFNYLTSKWGEATLDSVASSSLIAFLKQQSFKEAAKLLVKNLPYTSVGVIAVDLARATNKCGTKTTEKPNYCSTNPMHSQGGCH